jgi:hypothetical protein
MEWAAAVPADLSYPDVEQLAMPIWGAPDPAVARSHRSTEIRTSRPSPRRGRNSRRINQSWQPGDVAHGAALAGDSPECNTNWWPAQRPTTSFQAPTSDRENLRPRGRRPAGGGKRRGRRHPPRSRPTSTISGPARARLRRPAEVPARRADVRRPVHRTACPAVEVSNRDAFYYWITRRFPLARAPDGGGLAEARRTRCADPDEVRSPSRPPRRSTRA